MPVSGFFVDSGSDLEVLGEAADGIDAVRMVVTGVAGRAEHVRVPVEWPLAPR